MLPVILPFQYLREDGKRYVSLRAHCAEIFTGRRAAGCTDHNAGNGRTSETPAPEGSISIRKQLVKDYLSACPR